MVHDNPAPPRCPLEDRLFAAAFGLLTLVALAPIWSTPFPPLPDFAVHSASASIWAHLNRPEYHLREYYALSLGINPYWGYYLLTRGLAFVFSILTADRIVLSLYVLVSTLGMVRLCDRLGHSRWPALGAFAYLWTFSFNFGFIQCALSFALVPFALAELDAFCDVPSWRRAIVAAALGIAIYFNHALGWGLYLGAAGLLGLMHRGRSVRRMAQRVAVWSSVFVTGIVCSLLGRGKGMGAAGIQRAAFSGRMSAADNLRMLLDNTWNLCQHKEAQWAGAAVIVASLLLIATAKWTRSLHALRGISLFLTAIVAYFVIPRSVLQPSYIWGVNYRFAAPALLGLLLLIPGRIVAARLLLVAVIGAASLYIQTDAWIHWHRSEQFIRGFDTVVAVPPVGSRTLFIVREPWRDPTTAINYVNPYSWYQVLKGGFNPWNFEDGFPIRYIKRLPAPSWRAPRFDWAHEGGSYDYVVGFNAPDAVPPEPGRATVVYRDPRWTVWKIDPATTHP
jgi:hypothetical protein